MSLSEIIQDKQSALFEELGVIFAFSNKQFEEQKKPDTIYVDLGAGTLCPKPNAKAFLEKHSKIVDEGIKEDLATNGKKKIIERELANHECYYVGDYLECLQALEGYGITEEEIQNVFNGREI